MSTNPESFYEGCALGARDTDGRLRKPLEIDEAIGRPLAQFLNAAPELGRILLPPRESLQPIEGPRPRPKHP